LAAPVSALKPGLQAATHVLGALEADARGVVLQHRAAGIADLLAFDRQVQAAVGGDAGLGLHGAGAGEQGDGRSHMGNGGAAEVSGVLHLIGSGQGWGCSGPKAATPQSHCFGRRSRRTGSSP
jgi:hypothetical protein